MGSLKIEMKTPIKLLLSLLKKGWERHIRVAASDYHSNLSIILDIFRKKTPPLTLICSAWPQDLANL